MTTGQMQEFRDLLYLTLAELRASLKESADTVSPVKLDGSIGRLTRQSAMLGQQMAIELRRRNQARLQQVETAIRRIEKGEYGVCVRCEEEISPARLKVRPETQVCVRCAQGG